MRAIEVDFDVFKALTLRRPTESVTENDVLRELLGLSPAPRSSNAGGAPTAIAPTIDPDSWLSKGVRFPAGTEFRAHYKGETHLARVEKGALVLAGKRYDTPSAAAMAITGSPVNGWTFWECRTPGQTTWRMIKTMRPQK
ncbi:MAG: DUF2924 domain-containing protein [Burkholderiales bacterium]|nr:DUF2924 domain-containing protein [Burkholderiales bacterium]